MTLRATIALPRLAVLLAVSALATPVRAVDLPTDASAVLAHVIPPGQEDLVTRMLTPDATWPAGVALLGAEISGNAVVARYTTAAAKQLRVQLVHKDSARATPVAVTDRFALQVLSDGGPTDEAVSAVVAALAKQVGALESQFKWSAPAKGEPPPPVRGAEPPQQAQHLLGTAADAARSRDPNKAAQLALDAWKAAERLGAVEKAWVYAGVAAVLKTVDHAETPARAQAAVDLAATVTAVEGQVALARAQFALGQEANAQAGLAELAKQPSLRKAACPLVEGVAEDLALRNQPTPALRVLRGFQGPEPECVGIALAASRVARWAGVGAQALPFLERAAIDHPKDVAVAIHLAHLYKELQRFDEALRIIDALDYRGARLDKALVLDITRVYLDVADNGPSLALQRKRSDADPSEPVSAFIVGTILHHTDHWAESNRYLARSETAFAQEPRQFIYTGMNHYRLGNQAEAETRIERALHLGKTDPDIYYCRAVIRTRKTPDAALADLQTYLKMTAGSRETYAPKEAKVARMIDDLQACRDARDIQECLDLHGNLRLAGYWVPRVLAVLALLSLGWLVWRKRRRALAAIAMLVLSTAMLAPVVTLAVTPVVARTTADPGDLRPTLRAPTTFAAQWTWLSGLDRVQVGVCAVLLLASAGFFLPPRR